MKQKAIQSIILTSLMGSLILFGSGCSKKNVVPPMANSSGSGGISSGNDINYPPAEYTEESIEGTLDDNGNSVEDGMEVVGVDASTDPTSREYLIQHGRSTANLSPVYFGFDQITIGNDMVDKLVENAAYIQQTGANVVIAGNCDERGTNEYNLALGEKRALAAKQYLIDLGVDETQLRTISYGEERPLFLDQDEFSWSQNRRADFVVE